MNLQEQILYYYKKKKYNCSETIIHAANDVYSLNLDKDSMKMLAGFGSGLYSGKTCGALIGCVAVCLNYSLKRRLMINSQNLEKLFNFVYVTLQ